MTEQPEETPDRTDRFAYYSLAIQAVISVIALVLCFWLIVQETEAGINTSAFNIITFIIGVWLGRGIDYGTQRITKR